MLAKYIETFKKQPQHYVVTVLIGIVDVWIEISGTLTEKSCLGNDQLVNATPVPPKGSLR